MIKKHQFEAFEQVRESGETNMFDIRAVSQLSGLETDEIKEIIKNYDKLLEQYV